jgi:hypothetical protein
MIDAPWERLVSKPYAREVAAALRRRSTKPAITDASLGAVAAGGDCTTHISVVDRPAKHGLADPHGGVALRLARRRAGNGHLAQQRDDLVQPRAGDGPTPSRPASARW